ncbi:hypothetical protein FP2506_03279 [Fulvimarina pelagi HTCC2506]|uniref:Uncharacterized protein n=1 Tax=Fulvimarina pelagi HTCC2506 TaxID=314231 RepID=Q0G077_9HYPH|nr:hypothetical protein FP2506_03279 [Fulvimarina pelagi HTCC2506]
MSKRPAFQAPGSENDAGYRANLRGNELKIVL